MLFLKLYKDVVECINVRTVQGLFRETMGGYPDKAIRASFLMYLCSSDSTTKGEQRLAST